MRKQRNVYEVENMRGRKQDTLHTDKFEAYVKTICLKGRDGETDTFAVSKANSNKGI